MAEPAKPEDLNSIFEEIFKNLQTLKIPVAGGILSKLPAVYQEVTKAFEQGLIKTAEDVKNFFQSYYAGLKQDIKLVEQEVRSPFIGQRGGRTRVNYEEALKRTEGFTTGTQKQATPQPLYTPTEDIPPEALTEANKVKPADADLGAKQKAKTAEEKRNMEQAAMNLIEGSEEILKSYRKSIQNLDAGAKEADLAAQNRGAAYLKSTEKEAKDQERAYAQQKVSAENLAKFPGAKTIFANRDPRFADPNVARISTQQMANEHTRVTSTFRDENDELQKATAVVNKYGDAVERVPRNLRSFGQQLALNYSEVLKWSIAVGLLYTPMQKLNELTQVMIDNQTKLAQVAVTLGASQEIVNKIFVDASVVAKQTGTDLKGVIEGYNLAFRATGNASSVTERFVQANERLVASITLSKLANIEQSTATDILTASIEQLGESEAANGNKVLTASNLLDKWVAVSKQANVDVNTLATSFSIVGEAATAAGLSVDQLNGLIAVIAEKSGLTATQTGNAVRAIISGFQTDTAEKALQKYGIAIKDAQGNLRSFAQVFGDVQQQFQQNLITPTGLSDIARQMSGQGNRRQAQEIMAILGYPRMNEVAGVSAAAPQGAAQEAMQRLTKTIGTQLENLNTDFQVLAQTLGTSGGILGATTSVIKILDGFVNTLNDVAKAAGTALPFLVGLGAVSLVAGKGSPLNIFGQIGGLFSNKNARYGNFNQYGEKLYEPGQAPTNMLSANLGLWTRNAATTIGQGLVKWAPAIGVGIGSALMTVARAESGDASGAWSTGGLTLAGAALGFIGGPAGVAAGAAIGTSIGEMFATTVARNKESLRTSLELSIPGVPTYGEIPATKEIAGTTQPITALLQVLGKDYQATVDRLNSAVIKIPIDFESLASKQFNDFRTKYEEWLNKPENLKTNTVNGKRLEADAWEFLRQMATTPQVRGANGQYYTPITLGGFQYQQTTGSNQGLPNFSREIMTTQEWDAFVAAIRGNKAAAIQTPVEQSPYLAKIYKQGGFGENVRGIVKSLQEQELLYIQKQFELGRLSNNAAVAQKANVTIAQGQITNLAYPAVEGGMSIDTALKYSADIVAKGTADEVKGLVQQANDIKDLYDKITTALKTPGEKVKDVFDPTTGQTAMTLEVNQAQKVYDIYVKNYVDAVDALQKDLQNRTVLTPRIDYTKKGYTREDITGPIVSAAKEYNDKIIQGYEDASKQMASEGNTALADELHNMALAYANSQAMSGGVLIAYENGTVYVPGISSDALAAGETLAKERSTLNKGIDISQWDITRGQVPELMSTYNRILSQFKGAGYTPVLENAVVYTKDKDLLEFLNKNGKDQRIDAKVMQIALSELNDKAQKQLDGMYNLPEGSTFYVPYQAAVMSRQTVNATADKNTIELVNNTAAIINLTDALLKERDKQIAGLEITGRPVLREDSTLTDEEYAQYVTKYRQTSPPTTYKQYLPVISTPPEEQIFRETEKQSIQDYKDMLDRFDKMNAGMGQTAFPITNPQSLIDTLDTLSKAADNFRQNENDVMEKYNKWLTEPQTTYPYGRAVGQQQPNQFGVYVPGSDWAQSLVNKIAEFSQGLTGGIGNLFSQSNFSAKIDATIPLTTNVQVTIGAQQLAAVVVPIVKKELASALGRFSNSTSSSVGGGGGPFLSF